ELGCSSTVIITSFHDRYLKLTKAVCGVWSVLNSPPVRDLFFGWANRWNRLFVAATRTFLERLQAVRKALVQLRRQGFDLLRIDDPRYDLVDFGCQFLA